MFLVCREYLNYHIATNKNSLLFSKPKPVYNYICSLVARTICAYYFIFGKLFQPYFLQTDAAHSHKCCGQGVISTNRYGSHRTSSPALEMETKSENLPLPPPPPSLFETDVEEAARLLSSHHLQLHGERRALLMQEGQLRSQKWNIDIIRERGLILLSFSACGELLLHSMDDSQCPACRLSWQHARALRRYKYKGGCRLWMSRLSEWILLTATPSWTPMKPARVED